MMALANMQAKTISKNNLQNQYINKENKSFRLVQNHTHPNFYLIDLVAEKKKYRCYNS